MSYVLACLLVAALWAWAFAAGTLDTLDAGAAIRSAYKAQRHHDTVRVAYIHPRPSPAVLGFLTQLGDALEDAADRQARRPGRPTCRDHRMRGGGRG